MKDTSRHLWMLLLLSVLVACGDDSDKNPPSGPSIGPTITSFAPPTDTAGARVTIVGLRFSAVSGENVVRIGSLEASVVTAESTRLTVEIPRGATTGNLAVTVDGVTGTSSSDFVVKMTPVAAPNAVYNDVCWTGDMFVAVGNSGHIATSSNGRTWLSVASPITTTLRSVAGTDTGIVAVGDSGRVLFSANGSDWQDRPNGATGTLVSVCASANRFVAIPTVGGYVITSSDGLDWQRRDLDTTLTMSHVGYFGRFVAFANRLWVVSSLDGIQWRRGITNLTEPPVRGAAWSGTRGLITKPYSVLYLSGDNLWGECDPQASLMSTFSDIAWTGDYFVVVGDSSVIRSVDGWNWKPHSQLGVISTVPLKVACSPEACVVVGGLAGTIYIWRQP